MASYNDFVTNELSSFILELLTSIRSDLKVTQKSIVSSDFELNHYLVNGESCLYNLTYEYEINNVRNTITFDVPKLINNIFIVDGRFRVPVMNLVNSLECRLLGNYIKFDWTKEYFNDTDQMKLYDEDEDEFFNINSSDLHKFKEYLRLSDVQRKKLSIKLKRDIGEYIDFELLQDCVNHGSDLKKDYLVDKEIITVETSLLDHLRRKRGNIRRVMKSKLGLHGNLYAKDIQSGIDSFFNLQSLSLISIQIPTSINPLAFESTSYKVIIPKTISYNPSFADIIDPVSTPENNNVNKLNELNISASIYRGVINIEVYDKEFNRVKITYLDYLDSKVLINDQVDYENKKLLVADSFNVKYREDVIESNDFDYIDSEPDRKISRSTRKIPAINHSDSVRVAMGTAMMKQSVELANAEVPLMSSIHDEEDIKNNPLNSSYQDKEPGTVTSIEGNLIEITKDNGEKVFFNISNPIKSINDTVISFSSQVKVGDKVSNGSTIVIPTSLKSNEFSLGSNALVAFMPYRGYNKEDAIVISESYAKKLLHYSVIDLEFTVGKLDILQSIKDIGSEVTINDSLVTTKVPVNLKQINAVLGDLNISQLANFKNRELLVPNNLEHSVISDIKIIKGDLELTDETTNNLLSNFENVKSRKIVQSKLPNRFYYRELDDSISVEPEEFSYLIKVRLVNFNYGKVGDKLTNRYGSKGVISLIQPDKLMPRTEDGRIIEMVLNPYSIIARQNVSQLLEMQIGGISNYYFNKVSSELNTGMFDYDKFREETKDIFKGRFDEMPLETFILELSEKKISLFNIKMASFTNIDYEQLEKDLSTKYNQPLEEYLIDGVTGKRIKNPIRIGFMYFLKLYHLPEYSGKVTPFAFYKDQPTMGKGKYRQSGQKFGEMEFWALLCHNQVEYLSKIRTNSKFENYSFLNNLLMLGLNMKNEHGNIVKTSHSDKLSRLTDKYKR